MTSMSPRYQRIHSKDEDDEEFDCRYKQLVTDTYATRYHGTSRWRDVLIIVLITSNFLCASLTGVLLWRHGWRPETTGWLAAKTATAKPAAQQQEYLTDIELPVQFTHFKWWTAWGMEAGATNDTDLPSAHVADELWNGVRPDHGLVAVDRKWARKHNWPDSMYLPKDRHGREKGVYLLEGYHLIHCLKIIRLSFTESRRGLPLTWPVGHTTHCFDALRQSIQCNADSTPLYTFGDMTAGDGQARKCRSWDALRDWATQHSACYRDSVAHIPLKNHFGFCQDGQPYQNGKDGLP